MRLHGLFGVWQVDSWRPATSRAGKVRTWLESKLEISLVKERSSAVVIIASKLSLREKLDYLVGSA